MDLGIISIVKKLFRRVMVYIIILIVVGLLLNRGFLLFFGKAVWTYNRPGGTFQELLFSGGITFMLFIVFPVLYFFLFKSGYFESIVGLVRHEYRDELVHGMINHSSHMIIKHYGEVKGDVNALHTKMTSRFDDAPFWSKLVVNYLQKKLPIVEKIIEVVGGLDEEAFKDEETLKQSICTEIDPYLKRTDIGNNGGLYRMMKIVVINVCVLVGLYFILFYL